jgi:polyferredoxin
LLLLAGLAYWHGKLHTALWVGIPGAILFFFGAVSPRVLVPFYTLWMGLGVLLAAVLGTVILSILYYVLVTPIGLLVLLFKGNPLHHRAKEGSYWIPRERGWDKTSMEKLF